MGVADTLQAAKSPNQIARVADRSEPVADSEQFGILREQTLSACRIRQTVTGNQ